MKEFGTFFMKLDAFCLATIILHVYFCISVYHCLFFLLLGGSDWSVTLMQMLICSTSGTHSVLVLVYKVKLVLTFNEHVSVLQFSFHWELSWTVFIYAHLFRMHLFPLFQQERENYCWRNRSKTLKLWFSFCIWSVRFHVEDLLKESTLSFISV